MNKEIIQAPLRKITWNSQSMKYNAIGKLNRKIKIKANEISQKMSNSFDFSIIVFPQ